MNCVVHPDREASGYCRNCGKAMCGECSHKVRDVLYCEDCLARQVGLTAAAPPTEVASRLEPAPVAMPVDSKHHGGPAVALLLGFIPGLGAIYNGEYNKAILHIVIFGGIIFALASDFGESMQAFLVLLLCLFPFYMAIDAMRVAKARQTGEPVRDPFENWSSKQPLGPIILIGLGALFLLNNFGFFDFFRIKQLFLPLLLIGIGFLMLRNRVGGKD